MTNNFSTSSNPDRRYDNKAWVTFPRPNQSAAMRLFMLPYAGGSVMAFRGWAENLPARVEVCPVEIPGRGRRMAEPPCTDLMTLVQHMADGLRPYLDKPYALFGHSMGATLAFELSRLFRSSLSAQPVHLFVSGRRAPQIPEKDRPTYNLPEAELIDELRRLNGTPKEVLEHPDLMQLLMPILRADFQVVETYVYSPDAPLDCPITAFGGLLDKEVTREMIAAWREQTKSSFTMRMLDGDHFFLHSSQPLLLRLLSQELNRIVYGVK